MKHFVPIYQIRHFQFAGILFSFSPKKRRQKWVDARSPLISIYFQIRSFCFNKTSNPKPTPLIKFFQPAQVQNRILPWGKQSKLA